MSEPVQYIALRCKELVDDVSHCYFDLIRSLLESHNIPFAFEAQVDEIFALEEKSKLAIDLEVENFECDIPSLRSKEQRRITAGKPARPLSQGAARGMASSRCALIAEWSAETKVMLLFLCSGVRSRIITRFY